MHLWTVVGLSIAAVLVGLGIALGQGDHPLLGTTLVACGGSGAAVVMAIWTAILLGASRITPAQNRMRLRQLDDLASELIAHARTAADKGILLLADLRVSRRQNLFAEGVHRLIRAEPAPAIREALAELAGRESQAEFNRRRAIARFCRAFPLLALGIGFTCAMWMLIQVTSGSLSPTPSTGFALLCAVYGAFAVTALGAEAAGRLDARTAEDELAGSMIIETIVALRAGESPDLIAARLRGLIPPSSADLAQPAAAPTRKAA